ncbi:sodium/hydrogen exchanger 9B2-like, partial [Saccoglossus kowalevskii]
VQVQKILNLLWVIFQPFLFALIGAEILMEQLNLSTIGLGIAVILIALIFRTVAAFVSVMCAGLNFKEKCFISLAWLPKATVQAALGSIALDTAIEKDAPEDTIEVGKQ